MLAMLDRLLSAHEHLVADDGTWLDLDVRPEESALWPRNFAIIHLSFLGVLIHTVSRYRFLRGAIALAIEMTARGVKNGAGLSDKRLPDPGQAIPASGIMGTCHRISPTF